MKGLYWWKENDFESPILEEQQTELDETIGDNGYGETPD